MVGSSLLSPQNLQDFARDYLQIKAPFSDKHAEKWQSLAERNWPSLRQEGWQHGPQKSLLDKIWQFQAGFSANKPPTSNEALHSRYPQYLAEGQHPHLLIKDGMLQEQPQQLPDGVTITWAAHSEDLTHILATSPPHDKAQQAGERLVADRYELLSRHPFAIFSEALHNRIMVLHISEAFSAEELVLWHHIDQQNSPQSLFCQNWLVMDVAPKAKVRLREIFTGSGAYARHIRHDIVLGAQAEYMRLRIQQEDIEAQLFSQESVCLAEKSQYHNLNLMLGAGTMRHDQYVDLQASQAQAQIVYLPYAQNGQHLETHVNFSHHDLAGKSRIIHHGAVDKGGKLVFHPTTRVASLAQKTDGKQMTRFLLLDDKAAAHAKPELEIFADDVACGHGVTSIALDPEILFYVRSRGIALEEAQRILLRAFFAEAAMMIDVPQWQDTCLNLCEAKAQDQLSDRS